MSFHLHFTVWMKMHYLIWKKKDWLLFPNGKTHHRFNICNIATLQQMQYSCFHSNFVTSSFELSMMVMVVSILDRQPTRQSSCKYSCQFFSVLYWRSLSSPLSHLKFKSQSDLVKSVSPGTGTGKYFIPSILFLILIHKYKYHGEHAQYYWLLC